MAFSQNKTVRFYNDEFIEHIQKLPLAELLEIEFCNDKKWQKIFVIVMSPKKTFHCIPCKVKQFNLNPFMAHVAGRKHKLQIKDLYLYHPNYTFAKFEIPMKLKAPKQVAAITAKPATQTATATAAVAATPKTTTPATSNVTGKVTPKATAVATVKPAASAATPKAVVPIVIIKKEPEPANANTKSTPATGKASTVPAKPNTVPAKATPASVKSVTTANKQGPAAKANATVAAKKPGGATGATKNQTLPKSTPTAPSKTNSNATTPLIPEIKKELSDANLDATSDVNELGCPTETHVSGTEVSTTNTTTTSTTVTTPIAKPVFRMKTIATNAKVTAKQTQKEIKLPMPIIRVKTEAELMEATAVSEVSEENKSSNPKGNSTDAAVINNSNDGNDNIKKPKNDTMENELKETERIEAPSNDKESENGTVDLQNKEGEAMVTINKENETIESYKKENETRKTVKIPENSVKVASDVIVIEDDEPEIVTTKPPSSSLKRSNVDKSVNESPEIAVEPAAKKAKIIINPAAAFKERMLESSAQKKRITSDNDKPRYQSNLVIIPTKHKNKEDGKIKESEKANFSTKSYSIKNSSTEVQGLIGVEYVIKIMKSQSDKSPRYECGLCELVLDEIDMQNHLTGYNHRLKFCEKHFPTAVRQYRQFIGELPQHEIFKVMAPILQKLAVAIENHHGRQLPYEVTARNFNVNRHDILMKVYSIQHAAEQHGPTFTHVLTAKEVDELVAKRHTYKPESSQRAIFDKRASSSSSQSRSQSSKRGASPSRPERSPYEVARTQQTMMPQAQYGTGGFPQMQQGYGGYPMQYDTSYFSGYGAAVQGPAQVDDDIHKRMVENFLQTTDRGSRVHDREPRHQRYRSRDRHGRRSRSRSRSHSRSRHETRSRRSLSPLRENDIWQAYRHMVDQKVVELNQLFKMYRNDPETHPNYNDEWLKFWNRRKNELIKAGLDHRTYNYQPEWVRFFKVRVEELYALDVENIKLESRERLCLPMANDALVDPKYHVQVKRANVAASVETNPAPPTLTQNVKVVEERKTSDVISVLRILTALEEHLGMLGPKIINMLGTALQTEKTQPGRLVKIVLTCENCMLLETAMEKFKGLLIAGLLEKSKERAIHKAIDQIDNLLKSTAEERKKYETPPPIELQNIPTRKDSLPVNPPNPEFNAGSNESVSRPVKKVPLPQQSLPTTTVANKNTTSNVNLLDNIDKKELATKMAAALIAQGKTDYDPQQLQQLIEIYAVIEKKKREANNNSSTTAARTATQSKKSLSDTLSSLLSNSSSSQAVASSSTSSSTNNESQQNFNNQQSVSNFMNMLRSTTNNNANQNFNSQSSNFNSQSSNFNSQEVSNPYSGRASQSNQFQGNWQQFGTVANQSNWGRNAPNQSVVNNRQHPPSLMSVQGNTFDMNSSSTMQSISNYRSSLPNTHNYNNNSNYNNNMYNNNNTMNNMRNNYNTHNRQQQQYQQLQQQQQYQQQQQQQQYQQQYQQYQK